MSRQVDLYNVKPFGQAVKAARIARGMSRNELGNIMNIAPRYIASIENYGQHPSLQIFYELVTLFDISVDQLFFPEKESKKDTQRRQFETLLEQMDHNDLVILSSTAKGILEVKLHTGKRE